MPKRKTPQNKKRTAKSSRSSASTNPSAGPSRNASSSSESALTRRPYTRSQAAASRELFSQLETSMKALLEETNLREIYPMIIDEYKLGNDEEAAFHGIVYKLHLPYKLPADPAEMFSLYIALIHEFNRKIHPTGSPMELVIQAGYRLFRNLVYYADDIFAQGLDCAAGLRGLGFVYDPDTDEPELRTFDFVSGTTWKLAFLDALQLSSADLYTFDATILDDNRLIIEAVRLEGSTLLSIAHFDWTTGEFCELHRVEVDADTQQALIQDEHSRDRFLIVGMFGEGRRERANCLYGRVDAQNRIHYALYTLPFDRREVCFPRLHEGRLYCFQEHLRLMHKHEKPIWKYVVYDFARRALIEQVDFLGADSRMLFIFACRHSTGFRAYAWDVDPRLASPVLYVAHRSDREQRYALYSLDMHTLDWKRIGIEGTGIVREIRVEPESGVLMLTLCTPYERGLSAATQMICRYPTRMPDKLWNLCWFHARRQKLLCGRDLLAGVELPSALRSLVASE